MGWGVMSGTGVVIVVGGTGVSGTVVVGGGMNGVRIVVGRGSGIIGVRTGAGVGGRPRATWTSSPRSAGFWAVIWNCCVAVAEEVRNRTTPYPLASVLTSA
jgi:hypothetical protein